MLALALAAAVGVGADDWTPYSKDYARTVVELLERLPSTREHAAFLREERVELVVTDALEHVDDVVIASYNFAERRMYMDKVRLLNGADELQDGGAPPDKIGELLAWKTLPTIVHEIRHAMLHRSAKREFGAWLALPYLESEMLSFYDEVLALRELIRERPKLWAKDKILKIEESHAVSLRAWQKDVKELDLHVATLYAHLKSLLADPREKLLEAAKEGGDAEDARLASDYRATAAVLADEEAYGRLKRFMIAELRRGRKRLRAEEK